jgi:hypothetical protein
MRCLHGIHVLHIDESIGTRSIGDTDVHTVVPADHPPRTYPSTKGHRFYVKLTSRLENRPIAE